MGRPLLTGSGGYFPYITLFISLMGPGGHGPPVEFGTHPANKKSLTAVKLCQQFGRLLGHIVSSGLILQRS